MACIHTALINMSLSKNDEKNVMIKKVKQASLSVILYNPLRTC